MVGHRGVHGADARIRPGHSRDAAVVADPAALLARGRRGPARLLARARRRDRPAAAHHLCGPDPARPARAVHARPPSARRARAALVPIRGSRAVVAVLVDAAASDLARRIPATVSMPALARLRAPEVGDRQRRGLAAADRCCILLPRMPGWSCWCVLVAGWPWPPAASRAPVIVRPPVDPFARQFVYFFAIVPAFAGDAASRC